MSKLDFEELLLDLLLLELPAPSSSDASGGTESSAQQQMIQQEKQADMSHFVSF